MTPPTLNGPADPAHPPSRPHAEKLGQYESLDYEVYENAVYRARQTAVSTSEHLSYTSLKWLLCLLLALALSVISFLVNLGVENISGIKYHAASVIIQSFGALPAFLLLLAVNGALVLLTSAITCYYAPGASGSGIPEVKAFLNGVDVPGLHLARSLICKVVGVTLVVAAGLPLGKEGPFAHIGASVAALLCDGGGAGTPRLKALKEFRNDRDRRDLVTAGTAGGVAGAFRSPIGGLMFALEEMATAWRPHLLWRVFFTTAIVVYLARPLTRLCDNGACGFSARGAFVMYQVEKPQSDFFLSELLPLLAIGVVGGLLGALFISLNERINQWRRDKLNATVGNVGRVGEAMLAALVITTLSFLLPYHSSCLPCPPLPATESESSHAECPAYEGRYVQMACPGNHYNDLATLLFSTQDEAIRSLFSSGTENHFQFHNLIIFVLYYLSGFIWCFGMSFPAGSLVPSIVVGAAFGRAVGRFAVRGPVVGIDTSTYAVLGSAAMLAGVMRSTASLCIILLEITNNLQLLPMLMLVTIVSKFVADSTGVEGLFEHSIRSKGLPFLEVTPPRSYRHLSAADVAAPDPVSLPKIVRVRDLISVLSQNDHHAFPVISAGSGHNPELVLGLVLRSDVLKVLQAGRSLQASDRFEAAAVQEAYSLSDVELFSKPSSTNDLTLRDLKLSEDQLDKYLNLTPFLSPAPFVVQEETSLVKVYALFTKLNLRHLLVIPRIQRATGIISRKDIHPEIVESLLPQPEVTMAPVGAGAAES